MRRYYLPASLPLQVCVCEVDATINLRVLIHVVFDDEAGRDRRAAKHAHLRTLLVYLEDRVGRELGVIGGHIGTLLCFVQDPSISTGDQKIVGNDAVEVF